MTTDAGQAPQPPPYIPPQPLAKIPTPPFVVALAVITLLALVVAVGRLPKAVSDGIDMTRAEDALEKHSKPDLKRQIGHLESLAKRYPSAANVRLDLADAYEQVGDFPNTAKYLNSLIGASLSDEEFEHGKAISAQLSKDSGGAYDAQSATPDPQSSEDNSQP